MDTQINQEIFKIFIAALVGGIIGIEREKNKQTSSEEINMIGIRTNILIGIYGALIALLSQSLGSVFFLAGFISIFIFLYTPYLLNSLKEKKLNFKTTISSLMVFLLGALTMLGSFHLAIAISIIVTLVISMRYAFHKAVFKLEYNEIIDGIKFIFIAFIILPFLPDQAFDGIIWNFLNITDPLLLAKLPADILNPYHIWLLIVIISGLNFFGYMLVKTFGYSQAYGITGFVGGFYSSTATSLTLNLESKKHPELKLPFLAGITLACGTSFFKMFILLKALNAELFARIFPGMLAMCGYLLITGTVLHLKAKKNAQHQALNLTENSGNQSESILENKLKSYMYIPSMKGRTPLNLFSAFKLTMLIIGTIIVANLILAFSSVEFYSILAGAMAFFAVDDPIIVSTAEIAGQSLSFETAKNIILIVIYLNFLQKVATMHIFGNKKLTKYMAAIIGGLLLVTIFAFLYL